MFPNYLKRFIAISILAWFGYFVLLATSAKAEDYATAKSARCPQYELLLKKYQLPVAQFSAIMYRESRCTPKAIGWNYHKGMSHNDCKLSPAATYRRCKAVKSFDSGLLQINSSWRSVTAQVCKSKYGDLSVLLVPDCNLKVAKHLYKYGGGIGNWRATSKSNFQP
jgi:soluble lytic murein transglycosylase-like protein